ncbi:MAG: SDR family oxidoreductase [Alphaproteobacteria bacterium]
MASKVLVVTGGGRGIGAETCVLAARRGWDVCVNYAINATRAEETVARCRDAGARAVAVQADVASETDVARLFAAADELGPLGGLVNSAADTGPRGRLEDLDDVAGVERVLAVNVIGTLLCCRAAVRRMSTRFGGNGGAIVNLSSAAARMGAAGVWIGYAGSKGAVDTITWGLAQEVAADGIRVNAVSPGIIDTEMQPRDRLTSGIATVPLGRAGEADEVAAAILFLLSGDASYIAGAKLEVGGGR